MAAPSVTSGGEYVIEFSMRKVPRAETTLSTEVGCYLFLDKVRYSCLQYKQLGCGKTALSASFCHIPSPERTSTRPKNETAVELS